MQVVKFLALILICPTIAFSSPNPASQYCVENGGEIKLRQTEQGDQYGVCVWAELVGCGDDVCFDYSECEEWAFMNQSCKRWECRSIAVKLDEDGNLVSECETNSVMNS